MIITITPNPALDITYPVTELVPGEPHRISAPVERAGGKGVNVAAVLHDLGFNAVVLAPLGGPNAAAFRADLDRRGLRHELVDSPAPTRRSVAVTDPVHGATVFSEAGPGQPAEVSTELLARLIALLAAGGCTAITVSGSFAPGMAADWAAQVVTAGAAAGVPVLLDITGDQLARALPHSPALVKPNRSEAELITKTPDAAASARALVRLGAGHAVVSDGERGLVAAAAGLPLVRARLRTRLPGNPTGAGDALTAALAAYGAGATTAAQWEHALRRGVAWSAAAVLAPVAGRVDPDDAERLFDAVELEQE